MKNIKYLAVLIGALMLSALSFAVSHEMPEATTEPSETPVDSDTDTTDTDGDGMPDNRDPDDDNDGIPDEKDPDPKNPTDKMPTEEETEQPEADKGDTSY